MGNIVIINTKTYKKQPLPEVGKEYHIFDDGKINYGRHYTTEIIEIIPFGECKNEELIAAWQQEVKSCYWLFAPETDYFIKATSEYDKNFLYFVRTVDGGWFSVNFPSCWMGAELDIDGSLYESMIESYKD